MAVSVYTGAGGGVASFNGRKGKVVPADGDYTKAQVGLSNVDNVKQYSASNPPPYPVTSVAGKTGAVALAKGDVGLGNVDNTSDANKPISNATQAALNDKQSKITANGILKGDGSGNITAANETEVELVSLPNICNPNLLDNWYFGNPVDQRGGYVVKPNAYIYGDTSLTTPLNTTDAYKTVEYVNASYCILRIDGGVYYVSTSDCVRGYTGVVYGIDRWKMWQDGGAVTVENGGIVIRKSSGEYVQWGEILEADVWNALVGQTVTMSALTVNGQLATTTQTFTEGGIVSSVAFEGLTFHSTGSLRLLDFVLIGSESPAIRAVKLELGTQQTLAHQENGAWVLNEIPDYGEQLRRCQRMGFPVNSFNCYSGRIDNENKAYIDIPTPVELRDTPIIIGSKNGFVYSPSGLFSGEFTVFDITASSVRLAMTNLSLANTTCSGCFGNKIYLSADL